MKKEIAEYFLELASKQRLDIMLNLAQERSRVSIQAKKLDATPPEVHRNFERLERNGLIQKGGDGLYGLTSFGKMSLMQIPAFSFMTENSKYFDTHDFDLPVKFSQRIGALKDSKHIRGFVKVQEKWTSIYDNAEKYIYNILFEVSYNSEIISTVLKKAKKGIKIKSIFSESAVLSEERSEIIKKRDLIKIIQDGNIQRKMNKDVSVIVVLNEKEACVSFSRTDGSIDVSELHYSEKKDFHEWCLDFFNYTWENSGAFNEKKLGA